MRGLRLAAPGERLRLLCLGAHSDDIEIGAGATILGLIASGVRLEAHWVVLSAAGPRATEAKASAHAFLEGSATATVEVAAFRDGYFPFEGASIKDWLEGLRARVEPDLMLTHHRDDAHQDHRLVAELSGNTFRDHLTLAYEIPKWDGDLGRPGIYVPSTASTMSRKIELLMSHFATQRSKDWFDPDTFLGLARLRGMECRAPERLAEAFHCAKLVVAQS
ncbi:MAG: PIG-L deacetylase family protein [Hyphomicrobiaceae bacterium]|nr:PIG-L deacetylase family protein [Hyphomicrobiaceae bacterium]